MTPLILVRWANVPILALRGRRATGLAKKKRQLTLLLITCEFTRRLLFKGLDPRTAKLYLILGRPLWRVLRTRAFAAFA